MHGELARGMCKPHRNTFAHGVHVLRLPFPSPHTRKMPWACGHSGLHVAAAQREHAQPHAHRVRNRT
eukprot:6236752-Alexandrium_andersonii.AAC.1